MCRKLILLTSFVVVLSLVGNASSQPTGEILFEYWFDIGGTAVSDLTNAAGYPDNPDESDLLSKFEGPVNWKDNYGARVRGYLYPPADGDYTFWISGDDYIELYLSTDDDPANMALVAEVPGWTPAQVWDKYTEQQSAPITLAAGQKYYIEALLKEGGGGDSVTAAWTGPEIGEDLVVIDGAYLSAVVRKAARGPIPADGAVDADVLTLEWTAGDTAVSHKVYLSTDATIDESDLLAEGPLALQFADLAPGTAYYWRVDEVEADGTTIEGKIWSFTTLPIEAHFPGPEDGAKDVALNTKLSWTAGKNAILHDVYFGTDEAAVAASDPSTFKGKLMDTSFDPGPLEPFMTYYWKVDEFAIIVTNPGPVWSFSTPKYLVIDDDETTLDYDNSAEPYVSEASWDTPQDLTTGGLADLTLRFHGKPASEGSVSIDEATGTYTMTGSGADVWGSSDQFHYGYVQITGDATIVARVVDNGTGSNAWAKGGVMIRETLAPDSKHGIMALTGGEGGGITFQGRWVDGERSHSLHGDMTAEPPYWVKLVREGNTLTAYSSADGVDWVLFEDTSPDGDITNPQTVEMADPVLIGLFVTSHAAGEKRTYTFDNVDVVGNIIADIASTDIGIPGNAVEPLYVALEDSTGAVASVTHPYAAAVQIDAWRQWTIPLSKFSGVDPTDAAKLYVGVGDGEPGGSGSIRVDDIRVVMSATAANIVWVSDGYDDNGDGAPDDAAWVDLLAAQGHTVDYSIGNWLSLDDDKIAALNAADLVIVSRNSNSGDYDDGDEPTQWNSVTTPIILSSTHIVRSSRWKWLDTTGTSNLAPLMDLADGSQIQAIDETVGQCSFANTGDVGNGTLLASGEGLAWVVEWEAGVEFYAGAGQTAGGPRIFFVAGTQEVTDAVPPIGRGEMNLTPAGVAQFLNAVNSMLPAVELDVTVPGDIVKGVPDDGDWPGGEYPALAIDDNTGTKYLHFKGEIEPTGIQVTPLDGPSIVTGLTFTTANDAAERDPIAFELSGSNESIDGPYELIASGDIVDFAQADAWPRFTKNATPILFYNNVAYAHYQVLFPAVRDAASANSMQIAEVELLGVPAPAGPIVHYKLDDGEGVIAVDSANGLDGILMGDPQWSAGVLDGALDLDGDGDYVDCGTNDVLNNLSDAITVSAWVSIRSVTTTWMGIVMKGETAWRLGVNGNTTGIHWGFTGGARGWQQANSVTELPLDEWHHIAATYDKSVGGIVYVDGVAEAVNPDPDGVAANEMPLLLGENPEALGRLFDGLLDDVRIYDRALSADEISQLAGNILANGGFENGVVEPWSTYGSATMEVVQELVGAAVPEAPIEGSSCLHVVVSEAGANFWDAGLQHAGHVFEAGKQYTLSAFLKCNQGTLDINFKPEIGENPWTGYGEQAFTMTEEWTEFSVTTPVFDADVSPATITFHIGYAAGDFWVDGVRFVEVQ
ncbi:MAG: LamG-like jellyroll fold domain-containing protein [Planctomycetota bacterium]